MTDVSANVRITGSDETDAVWKALAAKMQNVTTLAKTCTVEMGQAASASSAAFDSLSGIVAKAAQTTGRSFEAQAAMSQKASVALKQTADAAKEVGDAGEHHIGGRFNRHIETATERVGEFAGEFLKWAAIEETIRRSIDNFAETDEQLTRLQQSSGRTTEEMRELGKEMREISRDTGESVGALTDKFQQFSADTGLVGHEAEEVFKTVAKAAEVTGTSMELMSRLTGAALHNMKVKAEEIPEVFDALVTELPPKMMSAFAQVAPQLTQSFDMLGIKNKDSMKELGAIFEVMDRTTGRPRAVLSEINSVVNTLTNIKTPLGAMLFGDMEKLAKGNGGPIDVIEAVIKALDKFGLFNGSEYNQSVMARMLGIPPQALKAFRDLKEHMGEIHDSVNKTASSMGTVNARAAELHAHMAGNIKELKSSWDEFTLALGSSLNELGASSALRLVAEVANGLVKAKQVLTGEHTDHDTLEKSKEQLHKDEEEMKQYGPYTRTQEIMRSFRQRNIDIAKKNIEKFEKDTHGGGHDEHGEEHHEEPEPKIFHGDPRRRPGAPAPASSEKHSDAGGGIDGALARSLLVKGVEYGLWGAQMAGKNIPFLGPINAATSAYGGLEGMYGASHSHPPESLADTLRRNQGGQTVRNMGIRGSNVHVLDASNSQPEGVPLHFGDQAPYAGGGLPIDYDKFSEAMKSFPESNNIEDRRDEKDSRTALEKNTDALERIIDLLQDGSGGSGALGSGAAGVGAAAGGVGSGGFRRGGGASSGGAAQRFTGGGTGRGPSPSGTGEGSYPMGTSGDTRFAGDETHMDPMSPAGSGTTGDTATITTPSGRKLQVNKEFAENFQGFVNDYEAAGGVVGPDSGGVGTRPGNASYHPQGRAMDINQVGYGQRSRSGKTLDQGTEDALAKKWGLYPGSQFKSRSDIGHFEVRNAAHARQVIERMKGGGVGEGSPETSNGSLAQQRERMGKELENPALREKFMRTIAAEDPADPGAFAENIMNRASARKTSLEHEMNSNYYPPETHQGKDPGRNREAFERGTGEALAGSNKTQYATGNASGRVGFGYGQGANDPHTYRSRSGERYGVENNPKDRAWAARMQKQDEEKNTGRAAKTEMPAKWTSPPDHNDALKEMRDMRSEMEKPIKLSARAQSYNTARRQAGRSAQRREQADETRSSRQNALMDIGFA